MAILSFINAEQSCASISLYNLAYTIQIDAPNTPHSFRPQDIQTTQVDWGDCTVDTNGSTSHVYAQPGTYQVRMNVVTLGAVFYMPQKNIVSIDRFPGVVDIANSPKVNLIPLYWYIPLNKIPSGGMLELLQGINAGRPATVLPGSFKDMEAYIFIADGQIRKDATTATQLEVDTYSRTQAELDAANDLVAKNWFVNIAIDNHYRANRPLVVADIMKADSYGNPATGQNVHSKMAITQSGTTLQGSMQFNPYSAHQEYYVRFVFKKPGESTFGNPLWVGYNRDTGQTDIVNFSYSTYPAGTVVKALFEAKYCTYDPGAGSGSFCGGETNTGSTNYVNKEPYVITIT